MSKFCVNCGTQLPEGTNACPNCGNGAEPQKVEKEKKAGNGFFAKVKAAFKKGNDAVAAKLKTFGIPMKAVYIALAVVLVLVVVLSIFGNAYKAPIKAYIDVQFKGKADKIERLIPKQLIDEMEDEGMELDDLIEYYEKSWEKQEEALEEKYGKYKVTYKITDKEKVDSDDLKDIRDELNEEYGLKKKSIKAAYELDIEIKIKGSDDDDEIKLKNVYSINIDGKWYLFDEDMDIPFM